MQGTHNKAPPLPALSQGLKCPIVNRHLKMQHSEPPTPSPSPEPAFCFRSIGLPCLIHSDGLLTQPFHHISRFDIKYFFFVIFKAGF